VTISGLAMKLMVVARPSLRPRKLRLNEVTIVFGASAPSGARRHWPMHGPHAFASTVAPISRSERSCPSRSRVARICSEPGVTRNAARALTPWARACSATSAARLMS
jgi:hypothetical protein